MNKFFLIVFCLFIYISGFSQKDSIINYLDRNYKKVEREQATYIQTVVKKDSLWLATLFHGNGKMKFRGFFNDEKLKTRVGVFKRFNEEGKLISVQKYNFEGQKDGVYLYFNDEGNNVTSGLYLKGEREGVWKYTDAEKNKRARIVFKKGKVVDYKLWNKAGDILNEELILQRKPQFKNGVKRFNAKLKRDLVKGLIKSGLKTNFLLKFNIDENGKVQDIVLSHKLNPVFEEKIINYFKNLDGLEPAIVANTKVKYPMEIPFIFN